MNEHDLMQALEGSAAAVDPAGPPTSVMIARAASVRKRRTASAVGVATAVAVIVTTVSLFGEGSDKSSAPEVVSPGGGRDGFAEALMVLPANTSSVVFTDPVAAAERLGLSASTAQKYDAALSDYISDFIASTSGEGVEDPGGLFGLSSNYFQQTADLPFNKFVVEWAVQGSATEDISSFTVLKMRPDTDLDAIADDLVAAGLQEEDLRGRRHLRADTPQSVMSPSGVIGEGYPPEFREVTVDTDADLLILGNLSERILQVLDGDLESAADAGTYDTLLGDIDDVEVANLRPGNRCLLRPRDQPPGIQKPAQSGYVVHGDDAALTARLLFDDADIAAADLEARTAYFETDAFGDDKAPLDSYGTYDVAQDGPIIDIELYDMSSQTLRELNGGPGNMFGC